MGEKGNWAPGPAAEDVRAGSGPTGPGSAGLGSAGPGSATGGKDLTPLTDAKGFESDAKGFVSPADHPAPGSGAGAAGPGGDGRSAGLPPLGGVLRRRDGGDTPDSGPAS